MTTALGFAVIDGGDRLDRLTASFKRYSTDRLPPPSTVTAAEALALTESEACDAWVVLDPRIEFIRPFGTADFLDTAGEPLVFASEERERLVDGPDAESDVNEVVSRLLGLHDDRRLRARGLSVWSSTAVRAWRDEWLAPLGWTYADALARCPDPGAWYLGWRLLVDGPTLAWREPVVAAIDTPQRALDYSTRGISRDDLARAYVAVLHGPSVPEWAGGDRLEAIGSETTSGELARALALRVTRKAPRVQGWLGLRG